MPVCCLGLLLGCKSDRDSGKRVDAYTVSGSIADAPPHSGRMKAVAYRSGTERYTLGECSMDGDSFKLSFPRQLKSMFLRPVISDVPAEKVSVSDHDAMWSADATIYLELSDGQAGVVSPTDNPDPLGNGLTGYTYLQYFYTDRPVDIKGKYKIPDLWVPGEVYICKYDITFAQAGWHLVAVEVEAAATGYSTIIPGGDFVWRYIGMSGF